MKEYNLMKENNIMTRRYHLIALLLGALFLMTMAPAFADRAPDWMVGTFEGYNSKYRQSVFIRMNRDGRLIVTNQKKGERIARNVAVYHRGRLTIDNRDYRLEKTFEGFRTVQVDDPENQVGFKRVGDYNEDW